MAKTPLFSVLKSQTCKSLGATILSLMKSAGWTDISSNPATDFIVMNSKGESGDANYCFQMKVPIGAPYDIQIRLSGTYTPGAPGSAGVFAVPTAAWFTVGMAGKSANYSIPNANLTDMMQDLFYNIDKDCCRFVTAPPLTTSIWGAIQGSRFIVIGSPDLYYTTKSSKDVMYITNYACTSGEPNGMSTSESYSESTGNVCKIDLINQTTAGEIVVTPTGAFALRPLTLIHSVSGVIGELRGIYGMAYTKNPAIVQRSIAQDSLYEYSVFKAMGNGSNIGNTYFFAVPTKQL